MSFKVLGGSLSVAATGIELQKNEFEERALARLFTFLADDSALTIVSVLPI